MSIYCICLSACLSVQDTHTHWEYEWQRVCGTDSQGGTVVLWEQYGIHQSPTPTHATASNQVCTVRIHRRRKSRRMRSGFSPLKVFFPSRWNTDQKILHTYRPTGVWGCSDNKLIILYIDYSMDHFLAWSIKWSEESINIFNCLVFVCTKLKKQFYTLIWNMFFSVFHHGKLKVWVFIICC